MSHDHGDHSGHSHGVSADADRRYLTGALILLTGYMLVEVVIGILANSLALISDAGHMLTDAASIVLALWAINLAARPARGRPQAQEDRAHRQGHHVRLRRDQP